MRQIKKGVVFYPTVDTMFDKFGEEANFKVEITNAASGNVVANGATGVFSEVMWTDPSHGGTVSGAHDIGSMTLTLSTGQDFEVGDRLDDGAGNIYYVGDINGDVLTLKSPLVATIADATAVNSVGNTGAYKVDIMIDQLGEYLVSIFHPDYGHAPIKYEIVGNTIDDVANAVGSNGFSTMRIIA